MTRPLDGLLVITIEQAIAAPYCTRQLADLGARVIKIERSDSGDFARAYDTRARGLSSHFVWVNRSKESLALDLKDKQDINVVHRLVSIADVFVQNLAPGAAERLGLGCEVLRQANPSLITCGISGYGQSGLWSDRKAYDLLIQAEAGFLSVTGTETEPAKAGISIADIAAGTAAFNGILAALIRRNRTQLGDHVEVSMLEAMAEWMGHPMYYAMDDAAGPQRTGASHASIFPYGVFDTEDGSVLFGIQNDREWANFAQAVLRRPDLAERADLKGNAGRFKKKTELRALIDAMLSTLSTSEVMSRLEEARIATAQVNDMKGLWQHPQLKGRGRWVSIDTPVGPMPALKPLSGRGWEPRMDAVPKLGEHTQKILAELGIATQVTTAPFVPDHPPRAKTEEI